VVAVHNTFNFYITKYTTNGANIKGFFALKKIIDNLHGEPEKKKFGTPTWGMWW